MIQSRSLSYIPLHYLILFTSFLVHSLRLAYLREVDDPYGARVISLDPSYQNNLYILSASLADVDRWPQLAMPISPDLSEDEQERPMRFPVRPLKHTQTIMGRRSGALGLRVSGKRASDSKRLSGTPRQLDVKNFISDQAPVQEALSTPAPIPPTLVQSAPVVGSWIKMGDSDEQVSPEPTVQDPQSVAPEQVPIVKIVQFIPKFKGAAEMEARRRERMAARRGPGGVVARVPPPPTLDFSSSSENEVEIPVISEMSSDEFDEVEAAAVDGMDEGDEFDPSVYNCHLSQSSYSCIYRAASSLQPVLVQRLTALQMLLRHFLRGLVPYLTRQSLFHRLTRILELVHD